MLNEKKIQDISSKIILVSDLSDEELLECCIVANQRYRTGNPIITDEDSENFLFRSLLNCIKFKRLWSLFHRNKTHFTKAEKLLQPFFCKLRQNNR